ncbi:PQQ-binding-like beta-propeller repeat protein [uncultured Campylobacter sp.]|uniref:PQQ-binding-like beta-propeller repeat protein n=1 Tax=uncultured Campylobacter sp. TaxID=218934 RepID=UPI0028EF5282|nr:PQQ-binding-like beta-propeller repeat protein [uncultured Campylobacter sp.]
MRNQEREALKKEWQKEWNEKGEKYAKAVNDIVAFAEAHGWDAYKGEEPVDERAHLGKAVFALLKEANERGETEKFRADFPPSNVIFEECEDEADGADEKDKIGDKLGVVDQICSLRGENALFVVSQSEPEGWHKMLYLLEGERVIGVADDVIAVGKSKRNEIYALLRRGEVELIKGYDGKGGGEFIAKFNCEATISYEDVEILPFNDGSKVLLVSCDGIFLVWDGGAKLIHPVRKEYAYIAMANAALSNDNELIALGDQDKGHFVINAQGETLGEIYPQSSYPHFCLFSADDTQLIINSCHFYNGVTIGVDRALLKCGLEVEAYSYDEEGEQNFTLIDDEMRVYAGVATQDFYILGDAYGYIRAVGKDGRKIWRHYLGGTIKSMALSEDGGVLFVGTYGGRLHKLRLGAGQGSHTIGNGNHKEEFRLIAYEDKIYRW